MSIEPDVKFRYSAGQRPACVPHNIQIRVLGSLLEKQRTTPDAYPLSVNALRTACNQSTNRDPVMDLDERAVLDALEELSRRRWVRLSSGAGSRARKYRQLFGEEMSLSEAELAVLCVLMLRGPQTPGELKARSERMHPFDPSTLAGLIERDLVRRLDRRPGQKEQRYEQLIGGDQEEASEPTAAEPEPPQPGPDRLAALEAEVAALRRELDAIKAELGA